MFSFLVTRSNEKKSLVPLVSKLFSLLSLHVSIHL